MMLRPAMHVFCAAAALLLCSCALFGPSEKEKIDASRTMIKSGEADCILISGGEIIASKSGRGVNPLMDFYDNSPELMANAVLVDKVIGRAAAAIAICGKVRKVYGLTMSEDAQVFLTANGIECDFDRLVPRILNSSYDDLCPLEKSVLGIDDPYRALTALKRRIAEFRKAAQSEKKP